MRFKYKGKTFTTEPNNMYDKHEINYHGGYLRMQGERSSLSCEFVDGEGLVTDKVAIREFISKRWKL